MDNSRCYPHPKIILSSAILPFELHIYPYGSHGLATVDTITNPQVDERTAHAHEWIDACKKWLRLRQDIMKASASIFAEALNPSTPKSLMCVPYPKNLTFIGHILFFTIHKLSLIPF